MKKNFQARVAADSETWQFSQGSTAWRNFVHMCVKESQNKKKTSIEGKTLKNAIVFEFI